MAKRELQPDDVIWLGRPGCPIPMPYIVVQVYPEWIVEEYFSFEYEEEESKILIRDGVIYIEE